MGSRRRGVASGRIAQLIVEFVTTGAPRPRKRMPGYPAVSKGPAGIARRVSTTRSPARRCGRSRQRRGEGVADPDGCVGVRFEQRDREERAGGECHGGPTVDGSSDQCRRPAMWSRANNLSRYAAVRAVSVVQTLQNLLTPSRHTRTSGKWARRGASCPHPLGWLCQSRSGYSGKANTAEDRGVRWRADAPPDRAAPA